MHVSLNNAPTSTRAKGMSCRSGLEAWSERFKTSKGRIDQNDRLLDLIRIADVSPGSSDSLIDRLSSYPPVSTCLSPHGPRPIIDRHATAQSAVLSPRVKDRLVVHR